MSAPPPSTGDAPATAPAAPAHAVTSTTPVRKSQGGNRFQTKSKVDAEVLKGNMARELTGQWVGPMPVRDLIDSFLKLPDGISEQMPKFPPKFFSNLEEQADEVKMYDPFIEAVANCEVDVLKGMKLVNTSSHSDRDAVTGMKSRPDVSCYEKDLELEDRPTRFEDMELIIEFKPPREPADPFRDSAQKRTEDEILFEPVARDSETYGVREKCRGQIACYARAWCARQHRTHCFILWLGDPYARIIRLDRSGGIVSAKFNYRTQGDILLEFLWKFSRCVRKVRGHDSTVSKAFPEESAVAREVLKEWEPSSHRSVFKLAIPDHIDANKTHFVFVWGPLADPTSVTGRATRGYPAWYPEGSDGKGAIVFVKDSWRSCEEGMEKESAILKDLNDHGCCNVPKLICGDDIPGHFTETKNFVDAPWNLGGGPEHIVKRVHTRFVQDLVGYHLETFKTSREFIVAIYHAVLAHKDAYEKCGILHRDISAGNILLKPDGGGGFLNDWDLAKRVHKDPNARQPYRSGTWQFMSAAILLEPSKINTVHDDKESFFWLVLYHILRYLKHNRLPEVKGVMEAIFDEEHQRIPNTPVCGGRGKKLLLLDQEHLGVGFVVEENEPLQYLVKSLLYFWSDWYTALAINARAIDRAMEIDKKLTRKEAAERHPFDAKAQAVFNYDAMINVIVEALDKRTWPTNDAAYDNLQKKSRKLDDVDRASEDKTSTNPNTAEAGPAEPAPRPMKKLKTSQRLDDEAEYRPPSGLRSITQLTFSSRDTMRAKERPPNFYFESEGSDKENFQPQSSP